MLNRKPGKVRAHIAKLPMPAWRRRLHGADRDRGHKAHRCRALPGIQVPRQHAAIREDVRQGLSRRCWRDCGNSLETWKLSASIRKTRRSGLADWRDLNAPTT